MERGEREGDGDDFLGNGDINVRDRIGLLSCRISQVAIRLCGTRLHAPK